MVMVMAVAKKQKKPKPIKRVKRIVRNAAPGAPLNGQVLSPVQNKGGRPSGYKPEYANQVKTLTQLGATSRELADFFHVSINTIDNWRSSIPTFAEAMRIGKDEFDQRVEHSLAMRAIGYTFDAQKIFCQDGVVTRVNYREHVAPDVTACIFWLKNRQPDRWRDVKSNTFMGNLILNMPADAAKY